MRVILIFCVAQLLPMLSTASPQSPASVLWHEMHSERLDVAISAGEKLRALPAESMGRLVRMKATLRLAHTYEKTADFERAARMFATYAIEYPHAYFGVKAPFKAGQLYARAGDSANAIPALQRYLALAPERENPADTRERSETMLTLIALAEENQDWPSVVRWVENYLATFSRCSNEKRLAALLRQQRALERLGLHSDAMRCAEKILSAQLNDGELKNNVVRQARAEAMFLTLEPEFRAYAGFKFDSDRTLGADLTRKLAMKKALVAKYVRVIEVGNGDMAIAALVRMASLTKLLADAIRNAPGPRLFDDSSPRCLATQDPAEEITDFTAASYESALAKAFELGLYNEWTQEAVRALSELQPDRFPELPEIPMRVAEAR